MMLDGITNFFLALLSSKYLTKSPDYQVVEFLNYSRSDWIFFIPRDWCSDLSIIIKCLEDLFTNLEIFYCYKKDENIQI